MLLVLAEEEEKYICSVIHLANNNEMLQHVYLGFGGFKIPCYHFWEGEKAHGDQIKAF